MQAPRTLRAAWAEIDLDALRRNADRLAQIAGSRQIRAVLKADAYGHGAVEVARALEQHGLDRFAVALVEEGLELRRGGVLGDILIMGPCSPGQCPRTVEHQLIPTVSSLPQVEMWLRAAAEAEHPQPVHLKVDTGMHRLGIAAADLPSALDSVRLSPQLELVGLMSHLADADLPESPRTGEQIETFGRLLDHLTDDEKERLEIHLANSAGLLHHEIHVDSGARPGLALFGYDPGDRWTELEPVMSVRASVVQVHDLEPGQRVGYGGRWEAGRRSCVGTVPVGYADGYPWRLGGKAEALVGGQRVPVVGAVSMDMLALDLTDTNAGAGDQVVLLGRGGDDSISADDLARQAETVVWGVLCGFGLRLPKLFVEDGRVIAVSSRHDVHATTEA